MKRLATTSLTTRSGTEPGVRPRLPWTRLTSRSWSTFRARIDLSASPGTAPVTQNGRRRSSRLTPSITRCWAPAANSSQLPPWGSPGFHGSARSERTLTRAGKPSAVAPRITTGSPSIPPDRRASGGAPASTLYVRDASRRIVPPAPTAVTRSGRSSIGAAFARPTPLRFPAGRAAIHRTSPLVDAEAPTAASGPSRSAATEAEPPSSTDRRSITARCLPQGPFTTKPPVRRNRPGVPNPYHLPPWKRSRRHMLESCEPGRWRWS